MISVIIPVYNVEKYLEKCVSSVLYNTYHDLEVICVNDGSPDNCLEILKRMQAKDDRIVIINQVNQGVQMARNNGIKAANGEYIAFIDSDDYIHPQYFETLLNCMEKRNANVVICGCQKFSEDEQITINKFQNIKYKKLSSESFYRSYYGRRMVWGRLFRRNDIKGIWFQPEVRTYDDTLFNLTTIAQLQTPSVYETETPLYYYLQREDSIVRTSKYEKMIDYTKWYAERSRDDEQIGPWSWVRLMQAIKLGLSYRYEARIRNNKIGEKRINQLLKKIVGEMVTNSKISIFEKIIHVIMIASPGIYRCFRILQDPTIKSWEKQVWDRDNV